MELEDSYRASLVKSFKKQVDDGYFDFIMVDCINNLTKHYEEMWSYAKQKGFEVSFISYLLHTYFFPCCFYLFEYFHFLHNSQLLWWYRQINQSCKIVFQMIEKGHYMTHETVLCFIKVLLKQENFKVTNQDFLNCFDESFFVCELKVSRSRNKIVQP